MPTALNHYFQRCLFGSMEDFLRVQTRHVERRHGVAVTELDSHLLLSVRIGRHYYRKRILFNARRIPRQTFPREFTRGHTRAILHYHTCLEPRIDHVEAVEYCNGRIIYLQYAEDAEYNVDKLPYTGMSIERYLERVYADNAGIEYLNLFVYEKIY